MCIFKLIPSNLTLKSLLKNLTLKNKNHLKTNYKRVRSVVGMTPSVLFHSPKAKQAQALLNHRLAPYTQTVVLSSLKMHLDPK